jgi:glycosyltransferase involved in cell wall biosynthesis
MRVLLSAAFDTQAGVGISLYIRRLVPELAQICELTVLTPDPEIFAGYARVVPIPAWTRSHAGRVAWTTTLLPRYCHRDFDAVLCPTPVAPPHVAIPVIAVVHDVTPLVLRRTHSPALKALFWAALQTLRSANVVVTDSENTRRDLLSCLGRIPATRIRVVPAGPGVMPTDSERSFADQFRPYVLYVGGHARHKNLPRLVAAFARLRRPDSLRLVIAGWSKPELLARTQTAIRGNGLEPKVTIISDTLRAAQLSSLYAGCTAFVYPSLYEGFGLPVLEALMHGAPVACSSTSSLPEVAGQAAVYFSPTDVDDLKDALEALLWDGALRNRLRASGPAQAAAFSWPRTAGAIAGLIAQGAAARHRA